MPTHQEIGGMSDEELLQRMANNHAERYGPLFWEFFTAHVGAHLPAQPVIVDLGCGPGLFLRDVGTRYPQAILHGYDVTLAMIEYARQVDYAGARPALEVHDLMSAPLPLASGSIHLITMTAVLHVLDEPLPVLAEIKRVLAPDGIFLLHDWIRTSLERYLAARLEGAAGDPEVIRRRGLRLFPVHNKYTEEDWRWLLGEAGFDITLNAQIRKNLRLFVTRPV